MNIRILGPMSVDNGVVNAVPTARKPRKVLALLLLNYSGVVPISTLIDELWGERRPKSAWATLQTYVLQVRKSLAHAHQTTLMDVAENILQTQISGYSFTPKSGWFDLHEYHRLEREGTRHMQLGELRLAADSFRRALELWRGPALTDVQPGRLIEAEVSGLEQSRLTMLEHRIELDLRLGLHRDVLGELATLVSRYHFHEDLHSQFMIALYRSGYRSRAIEVFGRLRAAMVAELGLEPSPKLHQLCQAIMAADSSLDRLRVVTLPAVHSAADIPGLVTA